MASDLASNQPNPASNESKSARRKKGKAEAVAPLAAAPADTASQSPSNAADDSKTNGVAENAYIKELQKNVRNITKKLNATQKVDSIIAENPGVPLDDLVASRKINADQKAQALKKPQLQAQLAQIEEQLVHYKKFEQELQQQFAKEKELLQSAHKKEIEELREQLKAEAAAELQKTLKQKYLTFSQFLRQAAAKRQEEGPDTNERRAFEGVLLLVYGGDAVAVDAIEKIVEGSNDIVNSVEDIPTGVTFAEIKQASVVDVNPFSAEQAWVDEVAQAQATADSTASTTDPTVANAGLTELDTTTVIHEKADAADTPSAPATGSVDAGAANAAAEEQWERAVASSEDPMGESFEMVPRDPQETENPHVPAPATSTQSWADDAVVEPTPQAPEQPAPSANGDGFREVHHNRGGRGRGGHDRGSFRGRPRGDGRGRGSFRGRGERGGPRGGFRGGRGRDGPSQ